MKYVQMLTHEIGTGCNFKNIHRRCPISIVKRPGSKTMPDSTIVENITRAYSLGFSGMCSWYYYCEPSLYLDRIEKIAEMVKSVPGIRHLLWTNGTLLKYHKHRLKIFSKVVISNYQKTSWDWVKQYVPDVMIVSGVLDGRKTRGKKTAKKCLRPYHEMIFDYRGNFRLCCGDHQGTISNLNTMRDGFEICLKKYRQLRNAVSKRLTKTAPAVCFNCRVRGRESIDEIVTGPYLEAKRLTTSFDT